MILTNGITLLLWILIGMSTITIILIGCSLRVDWKLAHPASPSLGGGAPPPPTVRSSKEILETLGDSCLCITGHLARDFDGALYFYSRYTPVKKRDGRWYSTGPGNIFKIPSHLFPGIKDNDEEPTQAEWFLSISLPF